MPKQIDEIYRDVFQYIFVEIFSLGVLQLPKLMLHAYECACQYGASNIVLDFNRLAQRR